MKIQVRGINTASCYPREAICPGMDVYSFAYCSLLPSPAQSLSFSHADGACNCPLGLALLANPSCPPDGPSIWAMARAFGGHDMKPRLRDCESSTPLRPNK